ncbi:MAG: DUF748 domain-containing protein [Candidatus Omnitrophota bacterium]
MKHRWILIFLAVVFFLTALTYYSNRFIFPTVIKKIAVEQAQKFLDRKVEIESLHFNWLKGMIVNKIKIYQKDSPNDVLVQAEKISLGFIFIPGFKQHQLTIPNINVQSPSLHLIHQADNQWNFSDLLATSAKPNEKPAPVTFTIGSITITNGKLRLDDLQPQGIGTELFDQINLRTGFSIGGITFNGTISIPKKQGFITVQGAYQPLNQSLKASVSLKNIKPLDYLSLIPLKLPLTLSSGTLKDVNAQIDYAPEKIDVQGDWSIENIDVTFNEQNIKTNMDVKGCDIHFRNNTLAIKGLFSLTNTQILTPTLQAAGSIKATVDNFQMNSPEDINIKASLQADNLTIKLPHDQSFQGQINAQIIQGRLQKDSISFEGSLTANQVLLSLNEQQNLKGDFKFNNVSLSKDKQSTTAKADINLNNIDVRFPGQIFRGKLIAQGLSFSLDNQNTLKINGPLDLNSIDIDIGQNNLKGTLHLPALKATFDQKQQILEAQAQGALKEINVKLAEEKSLSAAAHFDLHAIYPLKNPSGLEYNGSIGIEDARFEGLPFGPLKNINLTVDLKTDAADIQNLSLTVLDTPIKASGRISHFLKPHLNIEAQAGSIDLSKAKVIAPDLLKKYGINIDGEIKSFKLKFDGTPSDLSKATINGEGELQGVNVESLSLKQSLKDISGTIKATGDSISWEDFTATFMEKTITLTGHLNDFKNPKIKTSLVSKAIGLDAEINKVDNLVVIKNVSGHYLSANFKINGSIDLSSKVPQLDLNNTLKFKLEDLNIFLPDLKKTFEPLKLSGLILINSSITGSLPDWKNWTSTSNIESDTIHALGLKFNNLKIKVNQSKGEIQNCTLDSDFYKGTLNVISSVDLMDRALPADISLKIDAVDVASVLKEFNVVQDIRGSFYLTSSLKASLSKPVDVNGKGTLAIKEAYLADIELFKGILSPLKTIIPTSNLILTEVDSDYQVSNQKVTTDNLQLKGNIMNFLCKGSLGFDQSIDMTVDAPDDINQDSPIPSDIRKSIHYSVSGKISKPRIEHHFSEIKTLINVGKKILGDKVPQGLSDLLNQLPF